MVQSVAHIWFKSRLKKIGQILGKKKGYRLAFLTKIFGSKSGPFVVQNDG